jgi:15-cis-phytoene synthase
MRAHYGEAHNARPTRMDRDLRPAYAACRRMQRRHDPTYFAATSLLPAAVRPAIHAVYGFVRTADQIVDGPDRPATPEQRRAALDVWERELELARAGEQAHPVPTALVDAAMRHGLPLDQLHTYMNSMRVDCAPVRIRDDAELDSYMAGSAAAVGRIMAPLIGAPGRPEDVARLGMAFQLANFVRDVREDWALDRIYLPGLPESDLRAGHAGEGFRERVARQVDRARGLFRETRGVDAEVPGRVRHGMCLARLVYGRVLDRVERAGFDVLAA